MTRIYWILSVLLIMATTAATAWLYSGLPDQIPIHWNIRSEVDGYGGKWTLFLFPALMTGLLVFFYFLPALSPRHFQVGGFQSTYLFIMVIVIGLFAYMDAALLIVVKQTVANRPTIDLGRAFFGGLFLFFGLMGAVIGKVRRNFYIGIRVPWTLADDRVWNDTHRLAGKIWVAAGAIGLAMTLLGAPALAALAVLLIAAFIPVIYSFGHYKSLEKRGEL